MFTLIYKQTENQFTSKVDNMTITRSETQLTTISGSFNQERRFLLLFPIQTLVLAHSLTSIPGKRGRSISPDD